MRMRSELSAKEQEGADSDEVDKLHNVYFTYQTVDEELASSGAGGGSPSGRPSSAKKGSSKSAGAACSPCRHACSPASAHWRIVSAATAVGLKAGVTLLWSLLCPVSVASAARRPRPLLQPVSIVADTVMLQPDALHSREPF
jgi:hypothetical protein